MVRHDVDGGVVFQRSVSTAPPPPRPQCGQWTLYRPSHQPYPRPTHPRCHCAVNCKEKTARRNDCCLHVGIDLHSSNPLWSRVAVPPIAASKVTFHQPTKYLLKASYRLKQWDVLMVVLMVKLIVLASLKHKFYPGQVRLSGAAYRFSR